MFTVLLLASLTAFLKKRFYYCLTVCDELFSMPNHIGKKFLYLMLVTFLFS